MHDLRHQLTKNTLPDVLALMHETPLTSPTVEPITYGFSARDMPNRARVGSR